MRCSFLIVTFVLATGCSNEDHPSAKQPPSSTQTAAISFVEQAESELELLDRHETRAYFSAFTDGTPDHSSTLADASEIATTRRVALAKAAARFDSGAVPDDVGRKLARIKLAMTLPSPADPARSTRLAELVSQITGSYRSAANCVDRSPCRTKDELYDLFNSSEDPDVLADAWAAWRAPGRAIVEPYSEVVEIANEGARELGYADVGALWRSHYEMSPAEFSAEYERLWNQVRPLYEALHCHVRARLHETHGALVPQTGPIPSHLLGSMWAQSWMGIDTMVGPGGSAERIDVAQLLQDKGVDPLEMVRTGEAFFTSLGLPDLPAHFWERSMFAKPADRHVNCHATAYAIDLPAHDARMTMCVRVNEADFLTIHHELGHIYYYLAYADLPFLFRQGANPGFHEAIGDAIALSITPEYLQAIGLLSETPDPSADLPFLFRKALDKIPDIASQFVVDKWRWQVFSGEITPDRYNDGWWQLQHEFQGFSPPVPRGDGDFDAGMAYQVSFNIPVDRYFIAAILQFDIHRGLCEAAGHEGPLHRCSIFGSKEAGNRLASALALGASHPWPDALEKLTGSRKIDASSVVEYFAPVMQWLEAQNRDRSCGWR